MDKWEAAGKALPVVVVGRGVEEGPELGRHRQGCDKLFQAGRALSEKCSLWDLECQGWEEFGFSTRGTGSHTRYGARRGVDSMWAGGKC